MSRLRAQATYVGVLLLACAVVVGGVFVVRSHQDRSDATEAQERYGAVVAAAARFTTAFVNLDYRDPDASADAVKATATGAFLEQYDQAIAPLREVTTRSKAVREQEIVASAVSSIDPDSAVVLVYTSGTVRSLADDAQDPSEAQAIAETFRIRLGLVREGDRWLVNDVIFA